MQTKQFTAQLSILTLALASTTLQAFELSATTSFLRVDWSAAGISRLNIGIVSSTFNDMFSKLEGSSTVTVLRLLEAPKPVLESTIAKYVDDEYPSLGEEERQQIRSTLLRLKRTDNALIAKIGDPNVGDDTKILYSKEREKLLSQTFEYERQARHEYLQLAKPKAAARYRTALMQLSSKFDDALHCLVMETVCR